MALPKFLLDRILPRLNISKIIIDGQEDTPHITIEIEAILKNSPINSRWGFGIYSTDEEISSINNLQQLFENSVLNNEIIDLTSSTVLQEKIINENGNTLTSKTFLHKIQNFHLSSKNIIVFYGSWVHEPVTGIINFSDSKAEILYENSQIKSESYLYYIQGTQEIWSGDIQRSSDGLTFLTTEQQPRQLDRYVVKNYKIQNFLVRKQLEKDITSYKQLNETLLNARSKQLLKQDQKKKKYFTDLYLSQKERVSLTFGINFTDIILDNSFFGKDPVLSNELREELFNKSQIVDLKIIKRRVKEEKGSTNRLSDTNKAYILFPGAQEMSIASGKDIDSVFVSSDNIKEINSIATKLREKMRFFNCVDLQKVDLQDSMYQYGIKLEMMDGSRKIILQDIEELQKSITTLKSIYVHLDYFINTRSETLAYTEQQIEDHVKIYVDKIRKYFSIPDLNYVFNSLVSMLSPVSLNLEAFNNFIVLNQNLLSNLQNLIGQKGLLIDNPHIEDEVNNEQNTKNTFFIEYYFSNNIYDFSLHNVKKVEYLPSNANLYFNEFSFSDISFNNKNVIKFGTQPMTTEISPISIAFKKAKKQIGKTETREFSETQKPQFDKIIRQNLLKNINIEINKLHTKETGFKQKKEEEREDRLYEEDLAEMYRYFSSRNVKDKEIDEIFDLYQEYSNEFVSRIQFLQQYDNLTGKETWVDLSRIVNENFVDESGSLICKLSPPTRDYRDTKWQISENIKSIDMHFLLNVGDIDDLKISYTKFFGVEFSPNETPKDLKVGKEEEQKQVSIFDKPPEQQQRTPAQQNTFQEIENRNSIIKENANAQASKINTSTRNWVFK